MKKGNSDYYWEWRIRQTLDLGWKVKHGRGKMKHEGEAINNLVLFFWEIWSTSSSMDSDKGTFNIVNF